MNQIQAVAYFYMALKVGMIFIILKGGLRNKTKNSMQ